MWAQTWPYAQCIHLVCLMACFRLSYFVSVITLFIDLISYLYVDVFS